MGALRKHFGQRVRQLRKAAGLTQEELASRAGMSFKYVSSVERGDQNITLETLERLVRALGIEPYEAFLFTLREGRPADVPVEVVLRKLVRRADRAVAPLVIDYLQSLLRWADAQRK